MTDEPQQSDPEATPLDAATGKGQTPDLSPPIPKKIAHYTIKRVIATGGMGVVYEALQEKPRRTVALKVMKSGITSASALRRFEYESQLLARLQHPGIAQVYEVGAHHEGQEVIPFFAMEYVPNARPVTQYATEKKLGTKERMSLFALVCDAVHHGHQKGIIHRDLKPGNILVDPQGRVKIIDFGVARSTDSDMALTTLQTDVGQLIGTLQYMSPEQCEADPHDIDTRSDVYALGVVQYELLCGRLPYDVSKKAFHEVTRVIREEPPTRPSTISRQLRGDVETITLKALEKERARRYQSAVELAQDVRRYLAGEAIVGRPPSIAYQLRIFARRRKALLGALVAIFVVLAVGLVVSIGMYLRAEQAREDMARERDRAMALKAEAEGVTGFLSDTLASVDPAEVQGRDITIEGILDRASEKIDEAFPEHPLVEAALRATIGRTYSALGNYPSAEPHLETAFKLRERELGDEHQDTLESMGNLAELYYEQGKYDEAEPLLVRTLDLSRRLLGEEHPQTLDVMNYMGELYFYQGLYDDAELLLNHTLELRRRVLGEEHPDTLTTMNDLAVVVREQGRPDEAEPLFVRTFELRRKILGEAHPDTLTSMLTLAGLYEDQGRYDEAESLYVRTLELRRRVLGEEHPQTLASMYWLASHYTGQGRYDEAEPLYIRTLEIRRRVLGDEHPDTLYSMNNLAVLYREMGRNTEAEPLFTSAVAKARASLTERHRLTGYFLYHQGLCLSKLKRYDEAEAALLESRQIISAVPGAEQGISLKTVSLKTIEALAELYDAWDKPEKAAEWRAKLPRAGTGVASIRP